MRLDNHLALKHPDAEPVFLGRLKRAKEQSLDKIPAHPATAVRNAQNHPTVTLAGFHSNSPLGADRIPGIEDEIGNHLADLLPIHLNFRQTPEFLNQFGRW